MERTNISRKRANVSFGLVCLRQGRTEVVHINIKHVCQYFHEGLVQKSYLHEDEYLCTFQGYRQKGTSQCQLQCIDKYVDVRAHPMIEASFCDNIEESVANLSKYHEEMWLEPSVNVRIRAGFLRHSLPCSVLPSLTSSQPEGANKVYVHSKK